MCSILAQFWVCACVCQWACTMVKINWCRVSFVLQMKRFFQQCSCSIYRIPFLFRSEWEVYDKIKVLLKYRTNCIFTRAFRCCHVVVNSILSKLEMVSCEKWCSPVGRMEFHFTLHQKSAASLVFKKKMIASSFSFWSKRSKIVQIPTTEGKLMWHFLYLCNFWDFNKIWQQFIELHYTLFSLSHIHSHIQLFFFTPIMLTIKC